MSRLEGKVAVVTGASATYVECVQPVKAGDVPAIRLLQGRGSPDLRRHRSVAGLPGQMAIAKQEYDHADTLFSQDAPIPKSEFDSLKSQCTSQLHRANAAQAQADLAGDTIIRAPIGGDGVRIMQLIIQAKLAERQKT